MTLRKDLHQNNMAQIDTTTEYVGNGMYSCKMLNKDAGKSKILPPMTSSQQLAERVTDFFNTYNSASNGATKAPRMERRKEHIKLDAKARKTILFHAMSLDKERSVKFNEDLHTLVVVIKMMGMLYDDLCYFFDELTPQAIKQTMKNAEKDVTKLLDSVSHFYEMRGQTEVVASGGRTLDDFYATKMNGIAEMLRERVSLICNHIFETDEMWRMEELDKKLNDVLPEEYVNKRRDELYEGTLDEFNRILAQK